MCKVLRFILAALIMAASLAATAAPLKLASGRKALVKIVVAEKQGRFDGFAAEDLQSYLGRMAGAEFAVVKESELAKGEAAIYVGMTDFAAKNGLGAEKFGREEWRIKSVDDKSLVISGGKPIGAFYGVWSLLNHFGCYAITWDQDAIPKVPELTYDGFEEQRKPAFRGRMIYDHLASVVQWVGKDSSTLGVYYRWCLRNYINGRQDNNPMPFYLGGSFNIPHYPQYHSMESYLPASKYFKEHPEYYWMTEEGRRQPPPRPGYEGSLCMTNPEVLRLVTERMLEMIREDRATIPEDDWPIVYDFSRLDGAKYYCKCPECKKIEAIEGSQQGLFYRFLNQLSDAVVKQYPDIVIRTFAASNEGVDGRNSRTKPRDNILIWVSDNYRKSDCFRPLSHPINKESFDCISGLMRDGSQFMIWDYWNIGNRSFFNPPRVETIFDAIQPDIRLFRDLGATEMFMEATLDFSAPQNFMPLCHFIASQLMVAPERDSEQLANVFIDYYFGPNAPLMREWFNEIRAGVASEPRLRPTTCTGRWAYCTPDFLLRSYLKLKAAANRLPKDDKYRRRLEYEMIAPMWSAYEDKKCWAVFEKAGVRMDMLAEEMGEYVRSFMQRFGGDDKRVNRLYESDFLQRFTSVRVSIPTPSIFKDVPKENICYLAYPNFKVKAKYGATVVEDAEATLGKAFCGAHESSDFHGVDKIIKATGDNRFRTTFFAVSGASLAIKEIPKDEKYHWYRMDGKCVFGPDTGSFWGQGWAIHAVTKQLYNPVNEKGTENTWEQVWFRAKFTGPAYVQNSTRKNAIYVDIVAFLRDKLPEE